MELTEGNRIGLVTVVIAPLGKMYQLAAPAHSVTPESVNDVLDVLAASVNRLTEKKESQCCCLALYTPFLLAYLIVFLHLDLPS